MFVFRSLFYFGVIFSFSFTDFYGSVCFRQVLRENFLSCSSTVCFCAKQSFYRRPFCLRNDGCMVLGYGEEGNEVSSSRWDWEYSGMRTTQKLRVAGLLRIRKTHSNRVCRENQEKVEWELAVDRNRTGALRMHANEVSLRAVNITL